MLVADMMRERLEAGLEPKSLEIIDESEQHRGHAGYQEGGQSHFRVRIASDSFEGMSRIERHRSIHAALGKDLVARIHALAIEIEA
ncbi:BolA/IbaG family iron-sulfur metabolism protein [Alphaproteobacteria bacterium GH1-50]|uniref:BolA/IbaG family iron-sulfur metabolism protein n=1 Tax=Kangsaoukella pontilimi TaxID=2691042 RepID=A0A7C9IG62_9RHOB|nr:BolA family protein [Kangsaoukella pontilimi]MXQ06642.1 BolA/IbaG family iron-sulfur metabolism protein [Kangsaoukella pontilimi]